MEGWGTTGMADDNIEVRWVLDLSQAQCDKLSELSAPLSPGSRLKIQQTFTESGGTHLYALVGDDEWHIALNGNAIKMGPVDRNSLEHRRVVHLGELRDGSRIEDGEV